MKIFMLQGILVGLFGTLLGVGGGLLVACNIERILGFLEQSLHIHILPPAVYLMSTLPSDPHASDVFWVACMALLFSFLATLYPSWRAARVNPAEALRYE
jgi:lipoprotein-releasing system permease protein